jgi:hypothetical protein
MSNDKSSVEWLHWALEHTILSHEQVMQSIGLFEQAKSMYKQEIEKLEQEIKFLKTYIKMYETK